MDVGRGITTAYPSPRRFFRRELRRRPQITCTSSSVRSGATLAWACRAIAERKDENRAASCVLFFSDITFLGHHSLLVGDGHHGDQSPRRIEDGVDGMETKNQTCPA